MIFEQVYNLTQEIQKQCTQHNLSQATCESVHIGIEAGLEVLGFYVTFAVPRHSNDVWVCTEFVEVFEAVDIKYLTQYSDQELTRTIVSGILHRLEVKLAEFEENKH